MCECTEQRNGAFMPIKKKDNSERFSFKSYIWYSFESLIKQFSIDNVSILDLLAVLLPYVWQHSWQQCNNSKTVWVPDTVYYIMVLS